MPPLPPSRRALLDLRMNREALRLRAVEAESRGDLTSAVWLQQAALLVDSAYLRTEGQQNNSIMPAPAPLGIVGPMIMPEPSQA